MPIVVGVVFSQGGQVYPFDPDGLELAWNERVICNTPRVAASTAASCSRTTRSRPTRCTRR